MEIACISGPNALVVALASLAFLEDFLYLSVQFLTLSSKACPAFTCFAASFLARYSAWAVS
jgi:hypothetical protein